MEEEKAREQRKEDRQNREAEERLRRHYDYVLDPKRNQRQGILGSIIGSYHIEFKSLYPYRNECEAAHKHESLINIGPPCSHGVYKVKFDFPTADGYMFLAQDRNTLLNHAEINDILEESRIVDPALRKAFVMGYQRGIKKGQSQTALSGAEPSRKRQRTSAHESRDDPVLQLQETENPSTPAVSSTGGTIYYVRWCGRKKNPNVLEIIQSEGWIDMHPTGMVFSGHCDIPLPQPAVKTEPVHGYKISDAWVLIPGRGMESLGSTCPIPES